MHSRLFPLLFRSALFFLLIILTSSVTAGTRDPNTPDEQYVEFGKQFPCITLIKVFGPCDKPGCKIKEHEQFGSAVIIRENWVLTAAHVVAGTRNPVVINDSGEKFPLQQIIIHGEFDADTIGYHDLALGYSPKDFNLKFYCPLQRDDDEIGKAATIAGYGLSGTFNTGAANYDGKKRAGHNKIDSKEHAVLVCSPSVGRGRLPLEFMITPGDSGGGMFIGNNLAGINSFLMAADKKPDGSYGDESAFTRISVYVDWIERQIEEYELALRAQSTTGALIAKDEATSLH
jgi:secreted trypsin-like serine protease